ncbi:MAG TPA: S8 family serine peptidase [Polyangia bacterium]|nr:S8 family serine peptidase [Polyangia bacterium]
MLNPIRSSSLLVVAFVGFSLAGCGEGAADPVTETSSALTSTQSYLVAFSGGAIPRDADALVAAAGGSIAARYTNLGAVLARSAGASFAAALRASAGVDAVGAVSAVHSQLGPVAAAGEPHHPAKPPTSQGDPLSFRQWDMDQIHAPAAHAIPNGNRSVLVGMFDSGVDVTHPDLAGQVDAAASVSCVGGVPNPDPGVWSNDVIGHGTFTSGTIVAPRNGVGTVGVAPGAKIGMVKVAVDDLTDPNFGLVFADAVVCGLDWAIGHDYDLINASLTIDPFTAPFDDVFCSDEPDRAAVVQIVRAAILKAAAKKITVVAATGNFFLDLANLPGSGNGVNCKVLPVSLPKVIGVSAVGVTRQLAFYSDYGLGAVDLTGPGGDSLIPDPLVTDTAASGQVLGPMPATSLFYQGAASYDGQVQDCSTGTCASYAYIQGTSAAAPHVAGVAALVESRFGRLSPDLLLAKLSLAAHPIACPPSPYDPGDTGQPATCRGPAFYNSFYGAGEIDALAALK